MGMARDKAQYERLRQAVITARVARLARDTEDFALKLRPNGNASIERLQQLAIEINSIAGGLSCEIEDAPRPVTAQPRHH